MKSTISTSLILLLTVLNLFFLSCKDNTESDHYIIKGTITDYPEGKVLLAKFQDGAFLRIDSVFMTKGKFKFKISKSVLPELYHLFLDNDSMIIEFFSGRNDIVINAEYKSGTAEVIGSKVHNEYITFLENTVVFENKQRSLYEQRKIALSNNDYFGLNVLDSIKQNVSNEHYEFIHKYVAENNSSFVSVYITANTLSDILEIDELTALKNNFTDTLKNSRYFSDIESRIELLKKSQVGMQAPDFSLADTSGEYISLSSLQGRFVLLDFAASWHEASIDRNQRLMRIHNKYKNKGFEIFQVFLERDVSEWKSFIAEKGINWICVSDLKGLDCEALKIYGIKKIPYSFLLDNKGMIIQKDINSEKLELFLEML